jgi:hypothetical protein
MLLCDNPLDSPFCITAKRILFYLIYFRTVVAASAQLGKHRSELPSFVQNLR